MMSGVMRNMNENGAVSSHEEATPKTNYFRGKDNDSAPEMQTPADMARTSVMDMVNNPKEPEKTYSGMLTVKTANQWTEEAASRPDPEPLWLSLWYEGEVCCLFSDSNLGKSIYAVEIANGIAERRKVIYFDFELSDKQFQLRYTDDFGQRFDFPDNLLRSEIDPDLISEDDFDDAVIADIEQVAEKYDCRVLIIDNITYLNSVTEKADAASRLMLRLMKLKKKHGLSMLVLAHTPKRPLTSPITQNDLAGSKKLFNFFDSVFALGKSALDENLRYIKQIKVRAGAFEYGAENVIVAEIVKEGAWLHFRTLGYAKEADHLREPSGKDDSQMKENVRQLKEEGKSVREISMTLGISKSKVGRIMQTL